MVCECVGFCPDTALRVALLVVWIVAPLTEEVEDVVDANELEEYCFCVAVDDAE